MNNSITTKLLMPSIAIFCIAVMTVSMHGFALSAPVIQTSNEGETADEDTNAQGESELTQATLVTETTAISESLAAPVSEDVQEEEQQPEPESAESSSAEPGQQALEGTIVANRTDWAATFFVEGELRTIEPQRSTGIALDRSESGLNLFSCDAAVDKNDPNCFWDPYVINQSGFYEILKIAGENGSPKLSLELARAPASGQIWVQNRTELGELIFWDDDLITMAPTGLREFDLQGEVSARFFVRSCIVQGEEFVCEWLPQNVQAGVYYAMQEVRNATDRADTFYSSIQFLPIENEEGLALEAAPDALCTLLVPSLNIRSGPGLEYLILSQAFASATEDVSIRITGLDETGQWLATDGSIIEGGWIAYGPSLVSCTDGWDQLPIAEISDGRLAPVQEQAAAQDIESGEDTEGEESEEGEEQTEEITESPPKGQALLIIENAFEADVRFTFVDEIDLRPGERTSLVVNAGRVQFSVSSAWRGGMAGNAEFTIEPDETRRMFLYFIPDPIDNGEWLMKFE